MDNIILKLNTNSNFSTDDYMNRILYSTLYNMFADFVEEYKPTTKDGDKITTSMMLEKIEPYSVTLSLNAFTESSENELTQLAYTIKDYLKKFDENFEIDNVICENEGKTLYFTTNLKDTLLLDKYYEDLESIIDETFSIAVNNIIKNISAFMDKNLFNENKLIHLLNDYIDYSNDDMLFLIDDICNNSDHKLTQNDLDIGKAELLIEN